ncbi:hypothetical protein BKA58DRAFT_105599 [Alternaria rosae]|uniref:uncharacterized protein n=1 Tax=Alternaria rosae TaxID=1187941 RepID=UPI001E8DD743|nr:uncharacterized protein BKA58DRAFT_105599 [Alternaria rosae]KAH6878916.1 hypothetical protein BKA58DRAFT_105599 [Alternaria rosae]
MHARSLGRSLRLFLNKTRWQGMLIAGCFTNARTSCVYFHANTAYTRSMNNPLVSWIGYNGIDWKDTSTLEGVSIPLGCSNSL